MKIEKITPPINENDLNEQEKYFKCKFPEDYKKFLLEYNGGIPERDIVSFTEKDEITENYIELILGICNEYAYSLKRKNNMFHNRIPSNTIIIASDPGGNLFLMSIRGDDYGTIYFWDHEEEVCEGQEPDYSNLIFVAKSFTDLLNNLKDISELDD